MHYRYCPVCGGKLNRNSLSLLFCTECSHHFYQNSKPTVNALITRRSTAGSEPEVLLANRAVDPFQGHWDLPGGFLHNGEDPLKGLKREIAEELGLELAECTLFSTYVETYPRNDIPEEAQFTLCLFYHCPLQGNIPLRAEDDISEVRWFPLDALPDTLAFQGNRTVLKDLHRHLHSG